MGKPITAREHRDAKAQSKARKRKKRGEDQRQGFSMKGGDDRVTIQRASVTDQRHIETLDACRNLTPWAQRAVLGFSPADSRGV